MNNMDRKSFLVFIGMFLLAFFIFLSITRSTSMLPECKSVTSKSSLPQDKEFQHLLQQALIQRNNISRDLNLKQQKIGQMECEVGDKARTSNTGGWCSSVSIETGGQHRTDKFLAETLGEFFKGKFVASFGDGPGRYKQLVMDTGKVRGYDAYDGAPFSEQTSEGRVMFLDLTLPQYGLPVYDWIISLEVAEHIPKQYEHIFIDNLVRHANEGIILSWATIGQKGYSNVNNRPFEYVEQTMANQGFIHNKSATETLQSGTRFKWLKRNMNVYSRKSAQSLEEKMNA